MKKCNACNKELIDAFFNEQSGDDCVFCADDRITLARHQKHDHEEVEDKGCASGEYTVTINIY